jgi:hypothetical protein
MEGRHCIRESRSWAREASGPLRSVETRTTSPGVAPPGTPRGTSARAAGLRRSRSRGCPKRAWRRHSGAPFRRFAGRPCGCPGCNGRAVAALAPSLPGSRSRTALPGPKGPSCESASSASSRGATPAMAPMRFSAPRRGGRIAPSTRCPSGADRRPRSAVRVRRGGDPAWPRSCPRRPAVRPPSEPCSPSEVGAGSPALAFLGFPAPRPSNGARGPFKAFFPGRSSRGSWWIRRMLSWGSPL